MLKYSFQFRPDVCPKISSNTYNTPVTGLRLLRFLMFKKKKEKKKLNSIVIYYYKFK